MERAASLPWAMAPTNVDGPTKAPPTTQTRPSYTPSVPPGLGYLTPAEYLHSLGPEV